jgi:predicted glutamine amidotransferase
VNVHGCGIGWYARERCGLVDELGLDAYNRPTVYTTVAAPSHDRNLRALSKTISSSLLFGHVRAAGPGASVHQYNCHPFFKGRYMFMHNGDITDFSKVRRGLQHQLRDDLFDHMSGTTDSELLFLLILNRLPDCHTQQDPATLQQAVLDAFCAVIQANRGKANSLNIAFTDGETTIATRYRNSDVEEPPSLYYHVGPMPGESAWDLNNADLGSFDAMETDPNVHDHRGALTPARDATTRTGTYRNRNGMRGEKFVATQALLVSSEPLTGGKGLDRWELLPSNSMIVAAPTRPTVGRCTRAALVAKLKEIGAGGGRRHNLSESSAPVLEIEVKCIRSLCRDALGDECPETARGVSDARAEASASETPRFADSPRVASPTRRDDAGDFSGAFGSRDAPSGERSGGSGGSFVAASLPNKTFLHGPSMGVPFRSNSGGRLSNARRQSVDVSRMAEAPARAGGAGGAGGARPSALSATLGARARASDDREAGRARRVHRVHRDRDARVARVRR